jgi:nucleotide-binding universal stress UspA family protein
MGHIVVGVDESAGAAAALRWADFEAEARGWSLTALLAWGFLDQHHATEETFDPSYSEADAVDALSAIVSAAVGAERAGRVQGKTVNDLAGRALLEASEGTDLLVVGSRGRGGFAGLLLGSVSQQCLHYARCPVGIVRDGTQQSGEETTHIVVGVDGSDTSQRALEWALEAGRVHEATVEVVHAWAFPYMTGEPFAAAAFDPTPLADAARRTIDAAVESADTSGLPAPVTRTLMNGGAAASILEVARAADLVVVGSRGLGGFTGLVLGSVSHHVVHHAPCPVIVVPPPAGE